VLSCCNERKQMWCVGVFLPQGTHVGVEVGLLPWLVQVRDHSGVEVGLLPWLAQVRDHKVDELLVRPGASRAVEVIGATAQERPPADGDEMRERCMRLWIWGGRGREDGDDHGGGEDWRHGRRNVELAATWAEIRGMVSILQLWRWRTAAAAARASGSREEGVAGELVVLAPDPIAGFIDLHGSKTRWGGGDPGHWQGCADQAGSNDAALEGGGGSWGRWQLVWGWETLGRWGRGFK
jgi:hypothetical protein